MLGHLTTAAQILPNALYWFNTNNVILGINELCLKGMGANDYSEILGKTPYDHYSYEVGNKIVRHIQKVIKEAQASSEEDIIQYLDGKIRHYIAIRAPLYDDMGKIFGVIGTSIDITREREIEQLNFRNRINDTIIKEQEQFKKVISRITHDIQSPLFSLQIIGQSTAIPEKERCILRSAATSITDITADNSKKEQKQSLLLSANLLQILSEKRYEYKNQNIVFNYEFAKDAYFTFIMIEPSNFRRMISNVINNAVDALENKKERSIIIKLNLTNEVTVISIEDNGKGMSEKALNNIRNEIAFTNKKNGHGIGLSQIRDTLHANHGSLIIESILEKGTHIKLRFPTIEIPTEIAQEIKLFKDDIIVIVDDESSIHEVWDTRLASIINNSNIQVKHFFDGIEAIHFIDSFTESEKQKICLLTDYELLRQSINGLDVIKQTQIKRSILVTNYSMNSKVIKVANKDTIKILPKSLVCVVDIFI